MSIHKLRTDITKTIQNYGAIALWKLKRDNTTQFLLFYGAKGMEQFNITISCPEPSISHANYGNVSIEVVNIQQFRFS